MTLSRVLAFAQKEDPGFEKNLPLVFEPAGSSGVSDVQYLLHRDGMEILFTRSGADFSLSRDSQTRARISLRLLRTNPQAELAGEDKLSSQTHYFVGADPRYWRTHVANYARLHYRSIYRGIDLVFYGPSRNLEHDFVVSPGADAGQIAFKVDDAQELTLTSGGDLRIDVGGPILIFKKPVAYQLVSDRWHSVDIDFVKAEGIVGFKLGPYDHSRPLIIDPVLSFATYLDGTKNDAIQAVTTDATGNIYITGQTSSSDFPSVNAPPTLCPTCNSSTPHAFVSKLDSTGHTLLFSAFIGGSSGEFGSAIAVDANGNIILSGGSNSSDFPQSGAFKSQPPQINVTSHFMASLRPDGSAFNYAGLLGSGQFVNGNANELAIDGQGNAYLAGVTDSSKFPITAGTLANSVPGFPFNSMFIAKVDPTGALVYSTIVPGTATQDPSTTNNEFTSWGIAVDSNGNAMVAGDSGQGLPTTPNVVGPTWPLDPKIVDGTAGFVLKLNPTASALVFASYVPGADDIRALAVDSQGDLFVTGVTSETNLAVSANAFQKTVHSGLNCTCNYGYIAELDNQAHAVTNASYLTGTPASSNFGTVYTSIGLDSQSNIVVSGSTASSDIPLQNPLVSQLNTMFTLSEGYIAELSSDFSSLLFGSFLSGTDAANFTAVTVDSGNHTVLTGTTFGTDFPTTPDSFQPTPPPPPNQFVSFPHTFIAKIDLSAQASSVCFNPPAISFGPVLVGTSATQILNVANCGNAPLQFNILTSSVAAITATQNCGSVAPGNTCGVQLTFSPTAAGQFNGTLTLTDNTAIGTQSIAISGTAGSPQVFIPPSVQVADLLIGTKEEFFLGFINTGDGNWIVSSVSATGDFAVDNQCTAPLPPFSVSGASCFIGIIFSPTQPGLRTGTLTIGDNTTGSPHGVALSGNGLNIYPTPSIQAIPAVPADMPNQPMVVDGTNFFPASQVLINGSPRSTTYVNQGQLLVALTSGDLVKAGELQVIASNPAPGGGSSNAFPVAVYAAIRHIQILHTVFAPNSGLLFSSVSTTSANFANEVVVIDPSSATVVDHFSVGNGPNHLALSEDGKLLYVGLDGDKTVAQVALPAGTVNFTVGLGVDSIFGNPMVADALQVLPGQPHAWAVTLCGAGFTPCGQGIAVFDDAVERSTSVSQDQLQPDSVLFVGNDATKLYGTTLNQTPSTFYEFAISGSGITKTNEITNFSGESPGGGPLDTDGTSIFVSNGQVIDPSTLKIESNIQTNFFLPGFRVDAAGSHIYFAGQGVQALFRSEVDAFDIASQQRIGTVYLTEQIREPEVFRWGTNGLALTEGEAFILRTSLTGPVPPAQFSVSGLSPGTVQEGTGDLILTISGSGFVSGDVVTANGTMLNTTSVNASEIKTAVPASLLLTAGDLPIAITTPGNVTANLVLVITPGPEAVLSANKLTFTPQLVNTASAPLTVIVSNNGAAPLNVSSVTASGDFSQTNNCNTVTSGASCSISVTFSPTALGTRSGVLTVNDDSPSSSQSVTLSGSGSPFQIGGVITARIQAGQIATYNLSIASQAGFSNQVTFSCSNLPLHASCAINPPSATLGNGAVNVIVSISTSQQTTGLLLGPTDTMAAILGFPVALLSLWRIRRRAGPKMRFIVFAMVLLSLLVIGCGGGGGTGPTTQLTPQGTYTVNFTATASGTSQTIPLTLVVQ